MKLDNLAQIPEGSTLEQLPQTQLVDMLSSWTPLITKIQAEILA